MKVFSVAGYSKTGKTTVATRLISMLKEENKHVSAIKDIHFEDFTMERAGSNTHKMQLAGAESVFARGLKETYLIKPERMELTEMISMLNSEWLIIEGMKNEALPKIITADNTNQLQELVDDNVIAISGKISNDLKEYQGLPVINCLVNPDQLLKIVKNKVFEVLPLAKKKCCSNCGLSCYEMVGAILQGKKNRSDCIVTQKQNITLKIDGNSIYMVPFVRNILFDLIHAFIKNLKGYKKGKVEIELSS